MTHLIQLASPVDGFVFHALHAAPEGPSRGGVIVLQEVFGLDRNVRGDVARWCNLGFEVLAPSMFDREEPGFIAGHDPEGMQAGIKHAVANGFDNPVGDVQACIDHLAPRGPAFVVGYSYGGSIAWLAGARCTGLSAAASYYGSRVADMADLRAACPVIVHLGRKDDHILADAVKAALAAAQPQVQVYVYEGSGHAFNNRDRTDADPADVELARARTLALFEANGAAR